VVEAFTNGAGVDVAFEAVGISATCGQTLDVARDRGTIVWIGNNQRQVEIDMQAIVTRELRVLGSYGMQRPDFVRALQLLADGAIATDVLINRYATLSEGPALFPELLTAPNVIKCMFRLDEQ
jgi:L-iditol 2-dehydrogenase